MRAVVFAEYGGPEVLEVRDIPEPRPERGQIRVRVKAAGVTPADGYLRSGMLREGVPLELPHLPGLDVAGIVDEIGAGVTGVAVGDEVFGIPPLPQNGGGYAEFALLAVWAPKPAALSWAEAGGMAGNVETANRAMDLLGVREGTTLLIEGASGGVGTVTTQLARARGASVIGTATARNHALLRELGAHPTTYGPGLADRVAALGVGRVDAVLDAAGSGSLPDLVALAGSPDAVVTIADFQAAEHGVRMSVSQGPDAPDATPQAGAGLAEAARLAAEGRLTIPVERVFPLAEAGAAHALSATRRARGKIVLMVA